MAQGSSPWCRIFPVSSEMDMVAPSVCSFGTWFPTQVRNGGLFVDLLKLHLTLLSGELLGFLIQFLSSYHHISRLPLWLTNVLFSWISGRRLIRLCKISPPIRKLLILIWELNFVAHTFPLLSLSILYLSINIVFLFLLPSC